jgi:hypothetical protein
MGRIRLILTFDETMSQAIFHKKSFNLAFSLSFQSCFQAWGSREAELEATLRWFISLRAELAEKFPLADGVQKKSEVGAWLMEIFRISLTLGVSKMDRSLGKFQEVWGVMRSETTRLGGEERWGAGEGVKNESVGT